METVTNKATLRYGNATVPTDGADVGDALTFQISITATNVSRNITAKSGGGVDSSTVQQHILPQFNTTIVNPGGRKEALRHGIAALEQALAHEEEAEEDENTSPDQPIAVSDSITLIHNMQQYDNHNAKNQRKRAKVLNSKEIDEQQGADDEEEDF